MFYQFKNIYIKNNVFFDLSNMKIFQVNDESVDLFKSLYAGTKPDKKTLENNDYLYFAENYFNSDTKDNIGNISNFNDSEINNIQIKVSNTCNMKCSYCYAAQGNYGKEDSIMSLDMIDKVCRFINKDFNSIEKISFFGGEPFLNYKGISYILENINNREILYSAVTNGTLMDKKVINLFKSYNMELIVSIDGPEIVHDKYRTFNNGSGTYFKINENLKFLNENGIPLAMIEGVYTRNAQKKYTRYQISNFLYNKFKPRFIGISNVISKNSEYIPSIRLDDNPNEKIDFVFNKIFEKKYIYISDVYNIITMIINRKKASFFCGAGINSIFINEKGDIYPCQLFDEKLDFNIGNISDGKLKYYEIVKKRLGKLNKNVLKKCEYCICKFWCTICIGNSEALEEVTNNTMSVDCVNKQLTTKLVLDKFSEIINSNKFVEFIECMEDILNGANRI